MHFCSICLWKIQIFTVKEGPWSCTSVQNLAAWQTWLAPSSDERGLAVSVCLAQLRREGTDIAAAPPLPAAQGPACAQRPAGTLLLHVLFMHNNIFFPLFPRLLLTYIQSSFSVIYSSRLDFQFSPHRNIYNEGWGRDK